MRVVCRSVYFFHSVIVDVWLDEIENLTLKIVKYKSRILLSTLKSLNNIYRSLSDDTQHAFFIFTPIFIKYKGVF